MEKRPGKQSTMFHTRLLNLTLCTRGLSTRTWKVAFMLLVFSLLRGCLFSSEVLVKKKNLLKTLSFLSCAKGTKGNKELGLGILS